MVNTKKKIIPKYGLGRDFVYREFKKWENTNSLKEKDLKREFERNLG